MSEHNGIVQVVLQETTVTPPEIDKLKQKLDGKNVTIILHGRKHVIEFNLVEKDLFLEVDGKSHVVDNEPFDLNVGGITCTLRIELHENGLVLNIRHYTQRQIVIQIYHYTLPEDTATNSDQGHKSVNTLISHPERDTHMCITKHPEVYVGVFE